jgi:ribose transport system permease protein
MTSALSTTTRRENQGLRGLIRRLSVLLIFLALCIILSVLTPSFLTTNNLLNVGVQSTIVAIAAAGVTLCIITGGIDLSVGSVVALSGALSAAAAARAHLPVALAILVGMGVGTLCGAISGLLIARGGLPPFVATLAMMAAARGGTLVFTQGRPVAGLSKEYTFWGTGSILGIPTPIWLLVLVYLFTWWLLSQTRFGRYTYALGGSEEVTRLAGIQPATIKLGVYSLSGLFAGLAGVILTARLFSAQPAAGAGLELDAITAVVLGGTSLAGGSGGVIGTLLGALLIGVLSNGLNLLEVTSYYQLVIKGLVIILAVLLDMATQRR